MRTLAHVIAVILALSCGSALGLGGPENVLVVRNGNSPTSQRICDYYAAHRNIPSGNIVTIDCADSSISSTNERISPSDYTNLIEQPIRSFLAANNLTNQIQYIVLTKGIPIRLTVDPTGGQYGGQSVDSMLAAMDLPTPFLVEFVDEGQVVATTYVNPFWRSQSPFTHAKHGGYLVTRLDGYTEADAKALIDRSLASPTSVKLLLDVSPIRGLGDPSVQPRSILLPDGSGLDPSYELKYEDYNADMTRASQILAARQGLSVSLDLTNTFVGSTDPLLGYVSWGSNDSSFSQTTYNSLTFAPRAVVETAVSTSGRTFLPTTGGQSLIADLIAQGAAGAKGYVTEPFLDAVASPSVLFDFYTSGRNLAESFYAASRFVGWKDVVLGDPLCHLDGTSVATIAAAKALSDGSLVSLSGKVVTAGTEDFGDRFYISDTDRTSGIQVYLGQGSAYNVPRGSTVSVRGILDIRDGERCITNASVTGS